jgi:hypothetical protein
MHSMSGGCHCGKLQVSASLTGSPQTYRPRACDCDFCRKHGAAYVSDPQGSLHLTIRDEHAASRYRQGSGLAELLLCRNCGVLIAALYRDEGVLYGAVNATVLEGRDDFGPAQAVSPKTLSGGEKVHRWRGIWFADVRIATHPGTPPALTRSSTT